MGYVFQGKRRKEQTMGKLTMAAMALCFAVGAASYPPGPAAVPWLWNYNKLYHAAAGGAPGAVGRPAGGPPAGRPPAGRPPAGRPPAGRPPAGGPPPAAAPRAKRSDREMPKTVIWKGQRECQVKNTELCNKIMEKVLRECPLDDPLNKCMRSKFIARYRIYFCKPECTSSSIGKCTLVGGC